MSDKKIPDDIKHNWLKAGEGNGRYACPDCGQWTANLPLYKDSVCPKKERRTATQNRRSDD